MIKVKTKHILITVGLVALLGLGFLFLIYFVNLGDPLTNALKKAFPAKIVGKHMVSVYDQQNALLVAKKLDSSASEDQAISQLVMTEKIKNIADKSGIRLKSDDVSDELTYLKKQNESDYNTVVKDYFLGREDLFYRFVAYPQTWEALLRIHYNSELDINLIILNNAKKVLDEVKAKAITFEEAAKKYSDDKVTGQLGGDLGFFGHGQVLPELEDEIAVSTIGQVSDKVVVSRLGFHLLYVVETAQKDGQKLWHVKHILFSTSGFEEWLRKQAKDVKVITVKR